MDAFSVVLLMRLYCPNVWVIFESSSKLLSNGSQYCWRLVLSIYNNSLIPFQIRFAQNEIFNVSTGDLLGFTSLVPYGLCVGYDQHLLDQSGTYIYRFTSAPTLNTPYTFSIKSFILHYGIIASVKGLFILYWLYIYETLYCIYSNNNIQ